MDPKFRPIPFRNIGLTFTHSSPEKTQGDTSRGPLGEFVGDNIFGNVEFEANVNNEIGKSEPDAVKNLLAYKQEVTMMTLMFTPGYDGRNVMQATPHAIRRCK